MLKGQETNWKVWNERRKKETRWGNRFWRTKRTLEIEEERIMNKEKVWI